MDIVTNTNHKCCYWRLLSSGMWCCVIRVDVYGCIRGTCCLHYVPWWQRQQILRKLW